MISKQAQKIIIEKANKCWLCHDAVCAKVCKNGYNPEKMLQSLQLANLNIAVKEANSMKECENCDCKSCEKACLRHKTDSSVEICNIVTSLKSENNNINPPNLSNIDLSINFCGIKCINPFFLASSPIANSYDMCARAFEMGWGGLCFKTISFSIMKEVSPRFDHVERNSTPFVGFKNMEQLSEKTPEENFAIIKKLKENYPNHIIIASIMGSTDDEWTKLAKMATEAKADIIECNFSCPQMTGEGMGCDVGQNAELVKQYSAATRKGTNLPILAKMTPNIENMAKIAQAAIKGGASGTAAINTIKSITNIDKDTFSTLPSIAGKSSVSGYSGAAVRPIALRFISEIAKNEFTKKYPISGMGGIENWSDAVDFILLGCENVQICTSVMQYGYRIIDDLISGTKDYMARHNIKNLSDICGKALSNLVPPDDLDRNSITYPIIDEKNCIGCGRCYISCEDGGHQAIEWDNSRHPKINKDKCVGCHLCTLICPVCAIDYGAREKIK